MAKFFIGQKVKIVSCDDHNDAYAMALVGQEAIVNELDVENEYFVFGNIGVTVNGDEDWCFWPHELEPILPEGAQPLGYSFEQMMNEFGVTEAVK